MNSYLVRHVSVEANVDDRLGEIAKDVQKQLINGLFHGIYLDVRGFGH
jgi:hypothetical protein